MRLMIVTLCNCQFNRSFHEKCGKYTYCGVHDFCVFCELSYEFTQAKALSYAQGRADERARVLSLIPKKKRKHRTNGMRGEQYNEEKMEYGRPGDGYNLAIKHFHESLEEGRA